MKLQTYMRENEIDAAAMAEKIGNCSAKAVENWMYGDRFPRPNHLRAIAEATGGQVTASDFLEQEEAAQ